MKLQPSPRRTRPPRPLRRLTRLLRATPLTVALLVPLSASASFTTVNLLVDTVAALPSCMKYEVRGVCFFLDFKHGVPVIRTSIRIRHYLPEAVVSTYANPGDHPWVEIGMPLAILSHEIGSAIATAVLPTAILGGLDSSGETAVNNYTNTTDYVTYKSVDLYGNPVAHMNDMLTGHLPPIQQFTLPGLREMGGWTQSVLPSFIQSIRDAGSELANSATAQGLAIAGAPQDLLETVGKIHSYLGKIPEVLGKFGGSFSSLATRVFNHLSNLGSTLRNLGDFSLGDLGNLVRDIPGQLGDMASVGTRLIERLFDRTGMGGAAAHQLAQNLTLEDLGIDLELFTDELNPFKGIDLSVAGVDLSILTQIMEITGGLFCPPHSRPFTPHFISEIDSLTWRNILPLELAHAGSFMPFTYEVNGKPMALPVPQTWGSIYPRVGELVQQHPIKASAVLAERARSIVTQKRQPHIYTPFEQPGGWQYLGANGKDGAEIPIDSFTGEAMELDWSLREDGFTVRWQALYPRKSHSCEQFGKNDALDLLSWRDAKPGDSYMSKEQAYSWNMWRRHDCCKKKGSYLFSIP